MLLLLVSLSKSCLLRLNEEAGDIVITTHPLYYRTLLQDLLSDTLGILQIDFMLSRLYNPYFFLKVTIIKFLQKVIYLPLDIKLQCSNCFAINGANDNLLCLMLFLNWGKYSKLLSLIVQYHHDLVLIIV